MPRDPVDALLELARAHFDLEDAILEIEGDGEAELVAHLEIVRAELRDVARKALTRGWIPSALSDLDAAHAVEVLRRHLGKRNTDKPTDGEIVQAVSPLLTPPGAFVGPTPAAILKAIDDARATPQYRAEVSAKRGARDLAACIVGVLRGRGERTDAIVALTQSAKRKK